MATEEDTLTVRDDLLPTIIGNGWVARLFGLALALGGWTALASVFPNQLMPYPYETLRETAQLVAGGTAFRHVGATLWRTVWGFLGAWLLGITTGVVMGSTDYGERFLLPYLTTGLAFPAISWAAIATLVFGFGNTAPIVATALVTFPYITVNVWKGVEDIDADLVNMSRSFDVSRTRLLVRFLLPSIAPALFSAFRFSLAISWKIVTIAEMFASSSGVGYKIVAVYESYKYEEAWAWAVLFMLIVLAIEYGIARPLERRVFDYRGRDEVKSVI